MIKSKYVQTTTYFKLGSPTTNPVLNYEKYFLPLSKTWNMSSTLCYSLVLQAFSSIWWCSIPSLTLTSDWSPLRTIILLSDQLTCIDSRNALVAETWPPLPSLVNNQSYKIVLTKLSPYTVSFAYTTTLFLEGQPFWSSLCWAAEITKSAFSRSIGLSLHSAVELTNTLSFSSANIIYQSFVAIPFPYTGNSRALLKVLFCRDSLKSLPCSCPRSFE